MLISDVIDKNRIEIIDRISNKNQLLEHLIALANKSDSITDYESCRDDVFARERVMSTGVGKGIALPHAKTQHVSKSTSSLVIIKEKIDFDSLDKQPINVAFLLLSKSSDIAWHLKMLSKISRLLNNESYRSKITSSTNNDEVFNYIKEFDENSK